MKIYNNEALKQHIEVILTQLGLKFRRKNERIYLPCPLHGSKKSSSLSIALDRGPSWSCWTNHCEDTYGKSILGLVKGVLSTTNSSEYSWQDAVQWTENLIGEKLVETTESSSFKFQTIQLSQQFSQTQTKEIGIPRTLVRQSLRLPSEYFLKRKFSKEVLDKYDVGDCINPEKQLFKRAVVPVYNDEGTQMIGCVGRSHNPECPKCNKYHDPKNKCPFSDWDEYNSSKWINNEGFNVENYLYNFWNAKEFIELYQTAIVVEGQGDIWRLEEADIHIGLGLFGAKITDKQILRLEKLPIINLIVATDTDIPGNRCKASILEKLDRYYNIVIVNLPQHDIGEMDISAVKEFFKPILSKYIGI